MVKKCRICVVVNVKIVFLRKYKCSVNWIGFVKVMEFVMVC